MPAQYRVLVAAAGQACPAITPALVAAQIDQESNWKPNAVSPAGAVGIAQFMPSTWETVGSDHDGDGSADASNPADAIPTQAEYMCRLHDQIRQLVKNGEIVGDEIALTLAAYNAGIGRVIDAGGIPEITETRHYVDTIQTALTTHTASSVVWPLPPGHPDSDNFGASGSLWSSGVHTGDDIPATCGTPVYAVTSGEVAVDPSQLWAGDALVTVTSDNRTETWYAHMQRIDAINTQLIQVGDRLGAVGERGNAQGCHLHVEVHPNGGSAVDPHNWLIANGARP